ncbi:MAG: DUF2797 domain-containing protein [Candidatus Thorarchaeota archaeon]
MQILGISWRPQDDGSFKSGLSVWNEKETPEFIPINPGDKLSWVFSGPRRCVGSIDSSLKSVRCPENSLILQRGMMRCGPCSAMDFVDPCIRCDGRTCFATPERRTQCDETNYAVYMVVFNDETLKVGVSSEKRVRTRWVEQGADFGGILHSVQGGLEARRIEDRVGKNPKAAKQVRRERKIRSLLNRLDIEAAQSIVEDFLLDVKNDDLGSSIKLEDLSTYYSLIGVDTQPNPWKRRTEKIDGRPLVGEAVGMKGSLLVTSLSSAFTIIDLKQVIGYSLDYNGDITVVTQTGLLDFC